MKVIESLSEFPNLDRGCRVAIGKWDGIHVGHQRIVNELVTSARKCGQQSVVISFDRHPAALFNPDLVPHKLQAVSERSRMLKSLGVDIHLIIPFTKQFAALSPKQFVEDILVQLQAKEVMVGYNFMFGKEKAGNTETLKELCSLFDVSTKVFAPVMIDGEIVSSTKIRQCLISGEIEKVKRLLGRKTLSDLQFSNKNYQQNDKYQWTELKQVVM